MIINTNIALFNIAGKRSFLFFLALLLVPTYSFTPEMEEMGVKTIVIDAGHGGKDSGCLGASAQEKHVALAVALKLGKFIKENFKDVKVIYTRETDVFIELHERANIANRNKADLFICIHANASENKESYGSETYVMGLHKNNSNLNVAKRENSSILLEDNYKTEYEGFDPNSDESYIALSLMQSAYLDQSLNFADKIQKQFAKLGRRDRGVKQAGFLVLWRTAMPSVLIETGFLSNKEEEEFLANEANQEKMATGIYTAFKEYKEEIDARFEISPQKTKTSNNKEVIHGIGGTKFETEKTDTEPNTKEQGIFFKVQLASSTKKIPLNAENFNGLNDLGYYKNGAMYKYTSGKAKSMEEAIEIQKDARAKGYTDAFIVAFKNGERISVDEAKKLAKGK